MAVLLSAVGEINCAFDVPKVVANFLWVPMRMYKGACLLTVRNGLAETEKT